VCRRVWTGLVLTSSDLLLYIDGMQRMGTDGTGEVRERLETLGDRLEAIRTGMVELHDQLSPAPEELSLEDLANPPKLSTRIRADLRCLLVDSIEPALRSLRDLIASI